MKRLLIAALVIALCGCATVDTSTEGSRLYRDEVLKIKPGVTTRQAALELFGEPTEILAEDGVERFIYTFKEKKTRSYLGGLVEDETRKKEATTTLELVLREGIIYSYSFTSVEE
jgi:outer membrane protein assembly factor BamE (lipoprotein component of BamABCDE complex)